MKLKYINWIIIPAILFGCSTSQITSSWKAATTVPKKFNKILVVGLIREDDRSFRQKMEDHLVGDLRDAGYNTVSSISEYGPKAFDNMNEGSALQKLQNSGIDGVVTIVLLGKTQEKYYAPNRLNYTPYSIYQHRFWGYYNTMRDRVYTPGYYDVGTEYFWESNVYDVNTKELVYSVQTKSFDPALSGNLAHEYGKLIIGDIVKNNILTNQNMKSKAF